MAANMLALSSHMPALLDDLQMCWLQLNRIHPAAAAVAPCCRCVQVRTLLLDSNPQLSSTALLEALAAGPSAATIQQLSAADVSLDGEPLGRLLPQLPALGCLNVAGAVCASSGLADGQALLQAAEAHPALHTLV